jgi:predicted amidohydrolase YtcJ
MRWIGCLAVIWWMSGCGQPETGGGETAGAEPVADVILSNARIYTLSWPDPDPEGRPAAGAPYLDGVWQPDAAALAVRGTHILEVGTAETVLALAGPQTRVIDLGGATVIPGLVESHGHYNELGEQAERVDVSDAASVAEMAERLTARIARATPGEWIIGGGWDEGAWADRLPVHHPVSRISPDNPVVLLGRRGFGLLANARALQEAGISSETPSPSGGEVVKGGDGEPTGVLLNRARSLITDVIPAADLAARKRMLSFGLKAMVEAGYVAAHHAGVYADYLPAYEALAAEGALPLRVEVMLAVRPENRALVERWIERGPTSPGAAFLEVRAMKAYYDGSLGSRGARLLAEYSDQPGHLGVSGDEYGFPEDLVAAGIRAGFQVGIHAIGDAGNRAVLDFFERQLAPESGAEPLPAAGDADQTTEPVRHRIEHAQIIHPDDFERFGRLNLVASMEPGHAVEDSPWAEQRVGPERIRGAYAWRSLRRAGAGLIFNSDLAGTDHDIFYGLHCAVTRTDRQGQPAGGWYPEQTVTMEEALRAYTVWPARASRKGHLTGILAAGRWADLTVLSIDPFQVAVDDPRSLLDGQVLLTMVAGTVAFDRLPNSDPGRDLKSESEN